MSFWLLVGGTLCLVWALRKIHGYFVVRSKYSTIPSIQTLLTSGSPIGNAFPPTEAWWPIARGGMYSFYRKMGDYNEAGWNMIAMTSPFPTNTGVVFVSDATIIREIVNQRTRFPKPLEHYDAVKVYGPNVVATEGDVWKIHRKVSQPAFSEQNNRLVFRAAYDLMMELFDDVWGEQDEIHVEHALDLGVKIALMVLGIAGFGKEMSWKTESVTPPGHKMDFTRALYLVSSSIITRFLVPKWAMGMTKKLREIQTSYDELGIYMEELITEGLQNVRAKTAGKYDLLTGLVGASVESGDDEKGAQLSFEELRGNIFVYLIAGHETTAHTLVYVFGLLALHPEYQDKLHAHIKEVLGDREPTYEDLPALNLVLAVFYEALRLFPPVNTIPKKTTEDSTFAVSAADPHSPATKDMVIPVDTMIIIHTSGLHYNPRYWPNPMDFIPERFLGDWNRDAFLPFSGGPRSCIGRKFSETEGVCVLTTLLSRYTIHLTPEKEAEYEGLSVYEKRDRLLKSLNMITLTPLDVPLIFRGRK